ncbi:MAG: class I SAM-dependent methyltransferase [Armatimonadetes bacterium]|nr:class I SAM-dependent methyltransferase [Armatimonadota bacterium]
MSVDDTIERLIPGERATRTCGSATGYGTQIRAGHCGPTVGLDRECEALQLGRTRYPAPLAYVCGDGQGLPFAAGAFGLVVASQVLEHAGDPDAFCAELRRVCAPGGVAVVVVPNRLTQAPGETLGSACHAREFGPDDLRELVERHFGSCAFQGTFPGPVMARRERTDTWARQSASGDRLGLRRLIPRPLRRWLLDRLRGPQPVTQPVSLPVDLLSHYDRACFAVTTGRLAEAVDLVAICRP